MWLHSKKSLFFGLLTWLALTSCRDESTSITNERSATQRVIATKTFYLGIAGSKHPVVDTITIQGKNYLSAAFDSTLFQYDSQDRLVRRDWLQVHARGADYPGDVAKTTINAHWTTYNYQDSSLIIRQGYAGEAGSQLYRCLLDASQRRITSQTYFDPGSFNTIHDTLRNYSAQGLLTNRRQIATRPGLQTQTIQQISVVEGNNVVQTSSSFVELGQPFEHTTYEYDLSHKGSLSTMTMEGETSDNVLLRATTIRYGQNEITRYDYTYYNEFDQRGRLVRQTRYYQSPSKNQPEIQTLTLFYYQ